MSTNKTLSGLIQSQLPFFVREDHPTFALFMQKYYEYLEQTDTVLSQGKVIERLKNLRQYYDIDETLDDLAEEFYRMYIPLFPDDMLADKKIILKNALDFYRSVGTEKAIIFLFRAVYGIEASVYYPRKDILIADDGKWYVQKALRLNDVHFNNTSNSLVSTLGLFANSRIRGMSSNASAIVEKVDRFYEAGNEINEISLSYINGNFQASETVEAIINYNNTTAHLKANIYGGSIIETTILDGGNFYQVGDLLKIDTNDSIVRSANLQVSRVSSGNIASISVLKGGAGFRVGDYALITGGGGLGANAQVAVVNTDETYHPNSYILNYGTIFDLANGNLSSTFANTINLSNTIANSFPTLVYDNTGPIEIVIVNDSGVSYESQPTIDIAANTIIREYGIIGRLDINDGGINYQIGDEIEFFGGTGAGARANVTNIDGSGSITEVKLQPVDGFPIGGMGYTKTELPSCNISTVTGTGANVTVNCLLGDGEAFTVSTTSIGAIEAIEILDGGIGYIEVPSVNTTLKGDGTAVVTANIAQGLITYPGRFLNDDGFISSYNFLEGAPYYQHFSYVIRAKKSLNTYKKLVEDLVHSAGMKLFGEYTIEDEVAGVLSTSSLQETEIYVSYALDTSNYEEFILLTSNTGNEYLLTGRLGLEGTTISVFGLEVEPNTALETNGSSYIIDINFEPIGDTSRLTYYLESLPLYGLQSGNTDFLEIELTT